MFRSDRSSLSKDFGGESSLHAVESSKSHFDDNLEDYYEVDEKEKGDESEFVAQFGSMSSGYNLGCSDSFHRHYISYSSSI